MRIRGLKGSPSGQIEVELESPEYVRTSLAAAMTMGLLPGRFYRDARLHCLNLLLTYDDGCIGRCAYCGLSRSRSTGGSWRDHSFIRVEWPTVRLDDVIHRLSCKRAPQIERVCVSMVTNHRAPDDTSRIVKRLREEMDSISALIAPTIVGKRWLYELRSAGADKVGVAIDAATPELFERFRGVGVRGPHRWERYWRVVREAVEVFRRCNVGIHLIVGLGETEKDVVKTIQRAYDLGVLTHLFSFFPEENSLMQDHPQPPIGGYRRIQLARYLINKGISHVREMKFDERGRLIDFGVGKNTLDPLLQEGKPFMTSGCAGKTRENACNRPFSNCTPYQAYIGEMRNYPFPPKEEDLRVIGRQLSDYSDTPVKVWIDESDPRDYHDDGGSR